MEWSPTAQVFRAEVPLGFRNAAAGCVRVRASLVGNALPMRNFLASGCRTRSLGGCGNGSIYVTLSAGPVGGRRGAGGWRRGDFRHRCSEAGVTETVADVKAEELGAEPFSELSPVASPPMLSGSPEFYVDAGLELVKSLEVAEHELLEGAPEGGSVPLGTEQQLASAAATYPEAATESAYEQHFLERRKAPEAGGTEAGSDLEPHTQKSIIDQMREIMVFAGPALGIWLSGPLMSIIDTAVVGQSSSLELAALGPGTVLCDQLCYIFMFLSIATSNLIATSLARKDRAEAAGHLSRLFFVSFACGWIMFVFTANYSTSLLKAFVGAKNVGMVPAAQSYVRIRGFAWPAVLVGMVAQSACLGMQDSWGPLRVLLVASSVNCMGDIILCSFLGYGIAGAAWATMVSQYVGTFMMLWSLNKKGYNALAMSIPSMEEFVQMVELAAPVLLTMFSKVSFYTLITYLATSLGSSTLAGHQVMIGIFAICTVWGEPLCQTAQSFMPALIQGANRNLKEARLLLKSLLIIGAIVGTSLGAIFVFVPWFAPQIFTKDLAVISEMRTVTLPFWFATALTPPTLSCEGTLLAGRDLKYLGFSMASCFVGGSLLLLIMNKLGCGLQGSWWTLACFQLTRFLQAYTRLNSRKSFLRDDSHRYQDMSLKAA